MLKLLRLAILLFSAALLIAGGVIFWGYSQIDAVGPNDVPVRLVIKQGMGVKAIARELGEEGVIRYPRLFTVTARVLGVHQILKAGEYEFPAHDSMRSVLDRIVAHKTVVHYVTIPEGLTSAEIVEHLEGETLLTGAVGEIPPEGTLLPETYQYSYGDKRADIIRRMSEDMDSLIAELWPRRQDDLPFENWDEAITLASIVERETAVPEERAHIASVFINRLRKGMRLQSDPTVIYALTGGKSKLDRPLTREDWKFDSPYNTYLHDGLPPGPIDNPGRASIEAVLNPVESNDLYFVADGSGGHAFASTLKEHNRNVARWRQLKRDSSSQ